MFCMKCGQSLPEDAIFCSKCWKRVSFASQHSQSTKSHSAVPSRAKQPQIAQNQMSKTGLFSGLLDCYDRMGRYKSAFWVAVIVIILLIIGVSDQQRKMQQHYEQERQEMIELFELD